MICRNHYIFCSLHSTSINQWNIKLNFFFILIDSFEIFICNNYFIKLSYSLNKGNNHWQKYILNSLLCIFNINLSSFNSKNNPNCISCICFLDQKLSNLNQYLSIIHFHIINVQLVLTLGL